MTFNCKRCTRIVCGEEMYLFFGQKLCRACIDFVENDPEMTAIWQNWKGFLHNVI